MKATSASDQCRRLSSTTPGDFADGYPIGNGRIGVMCFGGPARLVFAINHGDLYFRPRVKASMRQGYWADLRADAQAGRWIEASQKVARAFSPWVPAKRGSFQPAAILEVWLQLDDGAMAYERSLDLAAGVAESRFKSAGETYRATARPDRDRAAARIDVSTTDPRGLIGRVRLYRPGDDRFEEPMVRGRPDGLGLSMRFPDGTSFDVRVDLHNARMAAKSIDLSPHRKPDVGGSVMVMPHPDARSHVNVEGLLAGGRKKLSLLVSVDVVRTSRAKAPRITGFTGAARVADGVLQRAAIELPDGDANDASTPRHYQHRFELGRYLFASSTHPQGLPPNLQGIWNDATRPICDSDFHMDLNVQMALWHAPTGNLLDYHEPLVRLLEMMAPGARRNAKYVFNTRGLAYPTTSVGHGEGLKHCDAWPGISGWLLEHLWTHWRYTLDHGFLRDRYYPLLREVSRFYLDYLVPDATGRLIVIPSFSPENRNPDRGNTQAGLNSTFDLSVFRQTLSHLVELSGELGVDDSLSREAAAKLGRLAAYPLAADGRLREMEDYEWTRGHRHMSHLHPLFPGDQVLPEDRAMMRSARLAIDRFMQFPSTGHAEWFGRAGYGAWAGWTYPLLACCCARAGMGDTALGLLERFCRFFTFENGLARCFETHDMGFGIHASADVGRWIQIDASLGTVAAIQEMLLQSHGGVVRLLPALPRAWKRGAFRGLRAEGGFEVDAEWDGGKLRHATVRSLCGQPCRLKVGRGGKITSFATKRGGSYPVRPD